MRNEMVALVAHFNMWFLLGWFDIRHRYRRSIIGPFWITISTGVMVVGIGLMFSVIFKSPIQEFLPYFAIGQIVWLFISTQINDACSTFVQYQAIINQISIPLSVHVMRKLWNNLILFCHNIIIVVVLMLMYCGISWQSMYVVPALIMILLLLFMVSIVLAIVCTRFRDIIQIVAVLLQLIYFFTPIFWMKNALPSGYSWITDYNPFNHIIELIRAPILGKTPNMDLWGFMAAYIVIAMLLATYALKRYRHRVAYWL
jgi:ABC-type polysaccharide/polyol phosphate export permease